MVSLTIWLRGMLRIKPKISIIIPFYNSEKYILRCLESIVLWTKAPYEIICVNDGSNDESAKIVKRFKLTHPQVRLVSFKENRGLYHARLEGMKRTRGDYVGFVDSDDYVSQGYFDLLYSSAILNDSDICVGQIININDKGIAYLQTRCAEFPYVKYDDLPDTVYEMYWKQQGKCYHWHVVWNKIYKRELIDSSLDYLQKQKKHLVMLEDFIFSSVLLKNVKSYSVNKNARYLYIDNQDNQTKRRTEMSIISSLEDMKQAFGFVENFLKDNNCNSRFIEDLRMWKLLYFRIWKNNILDAGYSENDSNRLLNDYFGICHLVGKQNLDNYYYEKAEIINV